MGILSRYATYVRELQRVPVKGHDTSGKEKQTNPLSFPAVATAIQSQ